MSKRSKKKKASGKIIFLIFTIGIFLFIFYLFYGEIFDYFKPIKRRIVLKPRKEVVLYFMDNESEFLIGERRKIDKRDNMKDEAKELIDELIKGSKKGLIPTIPPQTRCINLRIDEKGVAIVNFSKSLLKNHPGGSSAEMVTVYSIVNSLTLNFPEIKRVQIFIDGKSIDTISGHLSLRHPISPKTDLIKRSD